MGTNLSGLLNYRNLDLSGESARAVQRMEARSREPASQAMFEALVQPLLASTPMRILELGCGTGGLARRVARAVPDCQVLAWDKSEAMVSAARAFAEDEGLRNIDFAAVDVTSEGAMAALSERPPGLILSSVPLPYLSDEETETLIVRCARLLAPGGRLAFIEQDLLTDAVNFPGFDLFRRVYDRDGRKLKRTLALGLREVIRHAGLELEPRRSFLWTDDAYGPYVKELLGKVADDALAAGRISAAERQTWSQELERLAAGGDFYYGLVYHSIVGRRSHSGGRP